MRRAAVVVTIVVLALTGSAAAWYAFAFVYGIAVELDHSSELAELTPQPQSTIVYDREGKPAFTFFVEQRIEIPLDRVSPKMVDAILAVEDQRFYSHHGLDPIRIAAAARNNFRASRIVEGGSTITQQLARASSGLSPRRTFDRKIREAMIASRLEQRYSKKDILEAYLNAVYFGEGFYGVEAASRGYFGKPALDLEAHEAALLAAIVRSPIELRPVRLAEKGRGTTGPGSETDARTGTAQRRRFQRGSCETYPERIAPSGAKPRADGSDDVHGAVFRRGAAASAGGALRQRSSPARRPPRAFHVRPEAAASRRTIHTDASRGAHEGTKSKGSSGKPGCDGSTALVMLWRWSAGVTSVRAASIARRRPGDKQGPHSNRSSMRQHSNAGTRRGRC